MTCVNVALIGAGKFGINHLKSIQKLEARQKCNLVAVVESSKSQRDFVRNEFNVRVTDSLDDVLNEIEAVDIVTPASTHYDIAKKCINNNKSILVEKPFVLNFTEAKELMYLAKKMNVIVSVGHIFRYNNLTSKIKETIKSNKLGTLCMLDCTFVNPREPRNDVGALSNFSHWVDLPNFLLEDNPKWIIASMYFKTLKKFEDDATIIMQYNNNIQVKIHVGWLGKDRVRNISLIGTNSSINVNYLTNMISTFDDSVLVNHEKERETAPLEYELEDFIDCINSKKSPISDIISGVNTTYLIEQAKKSYEIGRRIECDLKLD